MEADFEGEKRTFGGSRNIDENTPFFDTDLEGVRASEPGIAPNTPSLSSGFRTKTALRLKYEAEVSLIRSKYGTLDQVRELLGLSQRKMCQLLLVDPSAWNRWTKGVGRAPPHIYRALEWYLHLQEKNPTLDQRFWLSQVANRSPQKGEGELKSLSDEVLRLSHQLKEIQARVEHQPKSDGSHEGPTTKRRVAELVAVALGAFALGIIAHRFF